MKLVSVKALTVNIFFILTVLGSEFHAQSCTAEKSSVKWKSPDSLFTVEVPQPLQRDKTDKTSYPGTKSYGTVVGDCVFTVYVIRLPYEEKNRSFSDKIDGLEFMLGGDDDHNFSRELLKVQKFDAKKIVYAKQNIQGLFINAGDYIFVLGFTSKNRANLTSKEAKGFFKSLRIANIIIDL